MDLKSQKGAAGFTATVQVCTYKGTVQGDW